MERLARLPAMMIIEDVDLISREREHMQKAGQKVLLSKLLNEMDGLREDADVLFILTASRPDRTRTRIGLATGPYRLSESNSRCPMRTAAPTW
jgi:SpoVK/Ycf46/Vps4 family AAA+-type ATPase